MNTKSYCQNSGKSSTFGEVMLRLTRPKFQRFSQQTSLLLLIEEVKRM